MSEYNLTCINCGHGPHQVHPCAACECKVFIRADIHIARAITTLNNNLLPMIMNLGNVCIGILEILSEAFPEARDRVLELRKEAAEKEQNGKDEATTTTP